MPDAQDAQSDKTADWWTMADIAAHLGVKLRSVHTYRLRGVEARKEGNPDPGGLPEPDNMVGRTPVWRPATIIAWAAARPGQGVGGGRPRKRAEG
jgi:cobalamin biosynthesis protein CobD/CbiB